MNIYRQLAENVWNPRVQSGADIQRMLDMMDKFQSGPVTSNIDSTMNQNYRYGGESAPQAPAMQGQMSDDPNSMATLGYSFGLPASMVSSIFGQQGLRAAQQAFPSPTTTVGKGVSKLGSPAMNYFTGIPSFFSNLGMRQFVNPLISFLEGQLGFGSNRGFTGMPNFSFNPATNQFDVDRTITPLSQTAQLTGLNMNIAQEPQSILEALAFGSMGPGTGGTGSSTGIGQGDAGEGMGMY